MNVLAGFDSADRACQDRPVPNYSTSLGASVKGLRVGVIDNHFMDQNTPDVQASIDESIAVIQYSGAHIVHFRIPLLAYGLAAIYAIELASSGAYHDRHIANGISRTYQKDVRSLVEMGRLVSAVDYLKAEQVRTLLCEQFKRLFDQVDVIVTPTEPITAWKKGRETLNVAGKDESVLAASWRLTYPFNLTGLPAISIPCGFDKEGMPIGLQIAGRPFDEQTVFKCAFAVENSLNLSRKPTLA